MGRNIDSHLPDGCKTCVMMNTFDAHHRRTDRFTDGGNPVTVTMHSHREDKIDDRQHVVWTCVRYS